MGLLKAKRRISTPIPDEFSVQEEKHSKVTLNHSKTNGILTLDLLQYQPAVAITPTRSRVNANYDRVAS